MERRAGPACPAAGMHLLVSTGRLVPPCRAGACLRRCAALPTTTGVGAGIPDGPGWGAVWARQGCRALRQCCAAPHHARCGTFQSTASAVTTLLHVSLFHLTLTKGRRPPPADGVGTAALGLTPRRLRHLRMALWTIGDFAPCAARVFRWLRPAGISPVATGDRGFAPGPHNFFVKKLSKNFIFGVVACVIVYSVVASCGSQQDASRFQNSV